MDPASIGLILAAATLLATLLAVKADERRSRHRHEGKTPCWTTWRVSTQPAAASEAATRATETRLAFWNGGSDTILPADLSRTDPFRLASRPGTAMQSVRLLRANSRGSRMRLQSSETGAHLIVFDYLRPGCGGLFSILHASSADDPIGVVGELAIGADLQRRLEPFALYDVGLIRRLRARFGDHRISRVVIVADGLVSALALFAVFTSASWEPFDRAMIAVIVLGQLLLAGVLLRALQRSAPEGLRGDAET
jgi:hypothetical protein